jgi:hypothetical protein
MEIVKPLEFNKLPCPIKKICLCLIADFLFLKKNPRLYGSIDETPLRNPNLGLPILKGKWKILVYFMAIWNILL